MKKKHRLVWGIAVLLLIAALVWLRGETAFLDSVSPEDVAVIAVRDGNTGQRFQARAPEDIAYLVENLQGHSFRRDGLSLFRMGTGFTLSFSDANGHVVGELIVNSAQTIRKDPFFYRLQDGDMQNLLDYLRALEKEAA